jgi:Protein of unknown function (DUF3606)
MADDLSKRGKPDQIRVNVHEDWELRERSKEWNVTPQQILSECANSIRSSATRVSTEASLL